MKRTLVSTIGGLLMVQLGACRGNSGQDAAEQSTGHATTELDVSWNLKTTEDGMPWTPISLTVNGNSFPVASGLATGKFWTWDGLSISDGLHELERVVYRVPPMEISMVLEEMAEESPQCGMEERTFFSCLIVGTEKRVSVCASDLLTRTEGYIQYRFGTPDGIEFQFPEKLDRTQDQFLWQTIGYSGGWDTRIQFTNEDYGYQIYDQAF